MDIEALKKKLNEGKGIRHIELSSDELEQKMKELNDDREKNKQSYIRYSKNYNDVHSVIGSSNMLEDFFEQHLTINAHLINYNEEKMVQIFRKLLIRFYKKELGQYFYKKKDKQIHLLINIEYGPLYQLSGEKHPHLHIILQHKDISILNRFHIFMKEKLQHYYPYMEYYVKNIDTNTYRKRAYAYTIKEARICYSNNDLCYSSPNTTLAYKKAKEEQNRLLEQKIAEIEAKQKVQVQTILH